MALRQFRKTRKVREAGVPVEPDNNKILLPLKGMVGQRVRIVELAKVSMNGMVGIVQQWDKAKGRFTVRLTTGKLVSLKPSNLSPDATPIKHQTYSDGASGSCAGCRQIRPTKYLRRCARCRLVAYCSKDCQRSDWRVHKVMCKRFRKVRKAKAADESLGVVEHTQRFRRLFIKGEWTAAEKEARAALDVSLATGGVGGHTIARFKEGTSLEVVDHVTLAMNVSNCHNMQGDYRAALDPLLEVMKTETRNPMLFYSVGVLKKKMGDFPGSIESYRRAVAITPSDKFPSHMLSGFGVTWATFYIKQVT